MGNSQRRSKSLRGSLLLTQSLSLLLPQSQFLLPLNQPQPSFLPLSALLLQSRLLPLLKPHLLLLQRRRRRRRRKWRKWSQPPQNQPLPPLSPPLLLPLPPLSLPLLLPPLSPPLPQPLPLPPLSPPLLLLPPPPSLPLPPRSLLLLLPPPSLPLPPLSLPRPPQSRPQCWRLSPRRSR